MVVPLVLLSGCMAMLWGNKDAGDTKDTLEPIVVRAEPMEIPFHRPRTVGFGDAASYSPPDFQGVANLQNRKKAFYEYLLPKVYEANREIMLERQWLLALRQKILDGQSLTAGELEGLAAFESHYRIVDGDKASVAVRVGSLLTKVDVVPASLVIAQAAKESGWGTSRFARDANNFFGIWCFYEGCGLTPKLRPGDMNHEVAMFASVEDGIRYYMRTINSHKAYRDLREVRANARRQNQALWGEQLAVGLVNYSQRGHDYVKEIQSMIRFNQLHRFTRQHAYDAPDPV